MAHSYYASYEHAVFSSKHRRPFLTHENKDRIFAYLAKAIIGSGCQCLIVEGHQEHVHLLYRKGKEIHTKDLLKEIKRQSCIWAKEEGLVSPEFYWQTGYGAFSISYWDLKKIKNYIVGQEAHHSKMTWDDEYRKLLKKHGIEFDERFFLN